MYVAVTADSNNSDAKTVEGFGLEWSSFDQSDLPAEDLHDLFARYFAIFPWNRLPSRAVGADIGCGSGRWAKLVAQKVGELHCVDASNLALNVARRNLAASQNVKFSQASVADLPFKEGSLDFAYSLGVLHHVPDTAAAIVSCVQKLKRGAPFLVYLYYRFDNRPLWFRLLWHLSEVIRFSLARSPYFLRLFLSQVIAVGIYLPLARLASIGENAGLSVSHWPLSFYRKKSFYVMRTDALDRFGTRLEQRFTKTEISAMMTAAGLENIQFSDQAPYWCAVGTKK